MPRPRTAEPESRSDRRRPHVAIAVVNLPVERDRRVIRECQALEAAGYRVTVICLRGPDRPTRVPGTTDAAIRSFPQPFAGSGVVSFAVEFAWSFCWVAWHLTVLLATQRLAAVQVCNPPDTFWPIAIVVRALGKPWIFDHHDVSPELYEIKTQHPRPVVTRLLAWFERMSMRRASAVLSTNESYRTIALTRGGCAPEKVTVVRNGPALTEVAAAQTKGSAAALVDGVDLTAPPAGRHRIAYVGVLGEQDRVDLAVHAAELLAGLRGRTDWELVIAGDGECLSSLRQLVRERDLSDLVHFTGWLEGGQVDQLLRSATIGIQPDPPTAMADLSTMAKTVEYVARGLPVLAADLQETRYTAGPAAVYVATGTATEFAEAIDQLLDDGEALATMSKVGLDRFRTTLAWEHQAEAYIRVWRSLVPVPVSA